MKTTVRIEGIEELRKALKGMGPESRKEVSKEIYATALDIKQQAKLNLKALRAWKTGNLANSVMAEMTEDKMAAEIGPEDEKAPYGIYVELGTVKMAARPFLHMAYFSLEGEFYKRITEVFQKMKFKWL